MQKPNLNQMWETFIKIGLPNEVSFGRLVQIIRFNIYPMISRLKDDGIINWYHFLIHNRESGVPTTEDDNNLYYHIRFALKKDIKPKDVHNLLPNYCEKTRPIERRLESISGIDKSLLKNEEIEEAWRIIGEQSEWLINMLNIHKEDIEIPTDQVEQFLHFYSNMTGLSKIAIVRIKCPYCQRAFIFRKDIFFMRQ